MVTSRSKRGTKKSNLRWGIVSAAIWFIRVVCGTILLFPAVLLLILAHLVLPKTIWVWYKSWNDKAPANTPDDQPTVACYYPPIDTETEINEQKSNHREAGTGHP